MNNLKRVLALSLAATSILSAAASASFTDTIDLATESAIDTLVGLGVIKGYEDGTFRPENTVTRAEMAKMIYTIKMGGNDASDLFIDVDSKLSDISGHWAEGYIKYCESTGIIAGRGDGKFYPEATVTGTEAIKMALVVLGYDADISGLTGLDWSINTLALGSEKGLTTDFVGSLASGAQRQSAATVLYNALYADMVKYSGIFESYETTDYTLASSAFNLATVEGATIYASTTNALTYHLGITATGTEVNGPSGFVEYTLYGNMDLSAYEGMKVDVLYNSNTKNVLGVKTLTGSVIVSDTIDNIEYNTTTGVYTLDGVEFTLATGVAATATAPGTGTAELANATDGNSIVTIVDYNDRDISGSEAIIVENIEVAKVTYVGSNYVNATTLTTAAGTLTGLSTVTNDVVSGVAKDDFVQVTYNSYDKTTTVEAIEAQTGTIDATKSTRLANGATAVQYQINGTWYTINSANTTHVPTIKLNDEIDFYAVGSVIYAAEVISDTIDNYAVILEISSSTVGYFADAQVALLFADGSISVVDTAYDYSDSLSYTDATPTDTTVDFAKGNLVAYRVNAAGEYVLKLEATTSTGETAYHTAFDYAPLASVTYFDSDVDRMTDGTNNLAFIADDAVIFVTDKDSERIVVTGAQLKSWDDTAAYDVTGSIYTTTISGYKYVQLANITLTVAMPGTTKDANQHYAYVTSTPYKISEDDVDYTVVTIWNGETPMTVKIDSNATAVATMVKGSLIDVTVDEDNYVDATDFAIITVDTATVDAISLDETKLTLTGTIGSASSASTDEYVITEDTVVVYVDGKNQVGTFGTVELANVPTAANASTYKENVAFTFTTTSGINNIDILFVEVSGDISLI